MRASMDRPWRKVEVKVEGIARPFRKNTTTPPPEKSHTPPATAEDQYADSIDHGTLQMEIEENPGLVGRDKREANQDGIDEAKDGLHSSVMPAEHANARISCA